VAYLRRIEQPPGGSSRISRALRFALTFLWEGLSHLGYTYWVVPPHYLAGRRGPGGDPVDERAAAPVDPRPTLPPRHPERLVADQPPTPEEAELWAELTKPDRPLR